MLKRTWFSGADNQITWPTIGISEGIHAERMVELKSDECIQVS